MGRHSCCIKQKLRKGLWSPEEDEKLYNYITRFGVGCWSTVPKLAGLQRCGKSCRLRWINYLRPDLKRGMFSQQEEDLIIRLHEVLGNRWAQIAAQLPGRTDNEIKNFWNSCLKKKLLKQGIDPNTHQPVIENEVKDDHKICTEKSSLHMSQTSGISNSSSTSSGMINASYNFGRQMEEGSRGQQSSVSKQVYDPFFLLDFQANLDPCGYNLSFLNQFQQSSRTNYDQNEFENFPNNGLSSLPNLTNSDYSHRNNNNMTDTDFSDHSTPSRMSSNDHSNVQMINNMLENSTATAAMSWDSDNKLDSVYQYQFNGIKIEEDVKPSPWQDGQIPHENSGDFSNYPLTSLSAEDFSGANLDHVFSHI